MTASVSQSMDSIVLASEFSGMISLFVEEGRPSSSDPHHLYPSFRHRVVFVLLHLASILDGFGYDIVAVVHRHSIAPEVILAFRSSAKQRWDACLGPSDQELMTDFKVIKTGDSRCPSREQLQCRARFLASPCFLSFGGT